MKYFLLSLSATALVSCAIEKPLKEGKSDNNKTYEVDYLFEHDGCKVYRFSDRGHYVYFTNCNGETIVKKDSAEVRNRIEKNK
jgi:hypothetical protein